MLSINERKTVGLYVVIIIITGFIFFKLYTVSTSDYKEVMPALADQYTRKLDVVQRRGFIFDRNGNIVAGFPDAYNCLVDPSKIDLSTETYDDAAKSIAQVSGLKQDDVLNEITQGKPFVIRINENINNAYMQSYRTYKRNDGESFPALHIVGYVDKTGNGVTGIEAAYNDFLTKTGSKIEAVYDSDALEKSLKGSPIRTIDYGYDAQTGISLTIDLDLQKKVEEIAAKYMKKGAIVVTSVSTGEILASVSRPTYSPDNLADYINSTNGEFINRAFSTFTPGSIFKTVVAAAALEEDENYYNYTYDCTGYIDVDGKTFTCRGGWGHGEMDMCEAYAHSCNTYFMNLALHIGYDKIYAMAKKLGIGEMTDLDGLSVQHGNIPQVDDPPPAMIANTAIGQGELLVTPLEISRIFCCIANNGIMPELSIVKSLDFENETVNVQNAESEKVLSDQTVEYLLEMTKACVDHGTGSPAQPEYGVAGGKTSSAESGQYEQVVGDDGTVTTQQIVHSWFAGYYPANTDANGALYSIAVIAEGGVTENVQSAAIFKEICDYLGLFLY